MACSSRPARSRERTAWVAELVDDGLDLGRGPGGVDDPAQLGDVVGGEVGAERAVEERGVGGRGGVEGEGDQDGALALDQVVAGGLAGGGRVAEDAEQVVAELEGLAQRQPTDQKGSKVVLEDGKLLYNAAAETDDHIVYNTISTPRGRQFQLVLPDGTKVWLNAASSLKFPAAHFTGNDRNGDCNRRSLL